MTVAIHGEQHEIIHDLCDRLSDIASEIAVVIAAINDFLPWSEEGYGLYLVLSRLIEQIKDIVTVLRPSPPQ